MTERGEDICVKKVNFYFKMLNRLLCLLTLKEVGGGWLGDVTTIFVHEKYFSGRLKI